MTYVWQSKLIFNYRLYINLTTFLKYYIYLYVPLLWMNSKPDFICMDELWATGNKGNIQNENVCLHRELNRRPLDMQASA